MPKSFCALLRLALVLGVVAAYAADGPLTLRRGLNIQMWATSGDLEKIERSGFDFVRLAVDPRPLLLADDARRRYATDHLERAVARVRQSGLGLVLALQVPHQAGPFPVDNEESERYRNALLDMAEMLARLEVEATALELRSGVEQCDTSVVQAWQSSLARIVAALRKAAPDLTLVVGGACGGDAKSLVQLDPAMLGDDRLLFGFHFFEPTDFTHQGVGAAKDVKGAPWPADPVAKPLALIFSKHLIGQDEALTRNEWTRRMARVRRHLDSYLAGAWGEERLGARFSEVRAWAERHDISPRRLIISAFGVRAADGHRGGALDADRFRWLNAVRREAEASGMAWAYWDYTRADSIAIEAMGLSQRAALPARSR